MSIYLYMHKHSYSGKEFTLRVRNGICSFRTIFSNKSDLYVRFVSRPWTMKTEEFPKRKRKGGGPREKEHEETSVRGVIPPERTGKQGVTTIGLDNKLRRIVVEQSRINK